VRAKTRLVPPWRSSAKSSIESAPATSEATFNPAFAPLSVGTETLINQTAKARVVGKREHGEQPARRHDIRSSNATDVRPRV
jgi:hypothetical protein